MVPALVSDCFLLRKGKEGSSPVFCQSPNSLFFVQLGREASKESQPRPGAFLSGRVGASHLITNVVMSSACAQTSIPIG